MDDAHDSMSPSYEQRWLDGVVNEMQVVNGLILVADPIDLPALLHHFVDRIPVPRRATERQLLRGLLLEFALRWSTRLHAGEHAGRLGGCAFHEAMFLEDFLNDQARDARASFAAWIDRFFAEFLRTHPPSTAMRAARRLRQRYAGSVTLPALARECHTTPARLTREFRRQFGMSVPQYQRTLRLVEALRRVRHEKIDSVALHVGYRSAKNFYRAFRELTGMTPTGFRRLSDERAEAVLEFATLALVRAPRRS
jgi:AraC-like DNA-binding protein